MRGLVGGRRLFAPTLASPRFFSSSSCSRNDALANDIRSLMRSSAQPVAIVTTFLGPPSSSTPTPTPLVHGATLSSFTTISLSPVPRIAFSLQLPSRMADSLLHHRNEAGSPHFVVNVLSSQQWSIAAAFAQPGIKPYDPEASSCDDVHPLAGEELVDSKWASGSGTAIPVLASSIGALACSLEASVDLSDAGLITAKEHSSNSSGAHTAAFTPGSRLFIARVHAVEEQQSSDDEKRPLIYWQQKFTTVRD